MTSPIAAIQAIGSDASIQSIANAAPTKTTSSSPVDWLSQQIQATDAQIKVADEGVQQLALGRDVELHRVMLDIEKARLSFDLVVQVRNRLVEAYQDVVRLQV